MPFELDELATDINKELLRRRYPAVRCVACYNKDEILVKDDRHELRLEIGCEHVYAVTRRRVPHPDTAQVYVEVAEMTLNGVVDRPDALEYVMTWFERLWGDLTDTRLV